MLLSIIAPTYNEAGNIVKFVKAIETTLIKYNYEIIFVDDNSSDKTHESRARISSLHVVGPGGPCGGRGDASRRIKHRQVD